MKKSLKSQLMAAIAMMIIASVALTSATYAWFTSVSNPTVGSINLNVRSVDNLMLSAYTLDDKPLANQPADWKNAISQTDISSGSPVLKWGLQSNAFPSSMINVSNLFDLTNHTFYSPDTYTAGQPTGFVEATQANDYVKFTLWAKSSKSLTSTLALSLAGSTVTSVAADPKSYVRCAVRVGFVPVDADTKVEDWNQAVIWEPNPTTHLPVANGGPKDEDTGLGITEKMDNKAVVSTTGTLSGGNQANQTFDGSGKLNLFTLTEDVPYSFNVYIWIEGNDPDAKDAVSKSSFITNLSFQLA